MQEAGAPGSIAQHCRHPYHQSRVVCAQWYTPSSSMGFECLVKASQSCAVTDEPNQHCHWGSLGSTCIFVPAHSKPAAQHRAAITNHSQAMQRVLRQLIRTTAQRGIKAGDRIVRNAVEYNHRRASRTTDLCRAALSTSCSAVEGRALAAVWRISSTRGEYSRIARAMRSRPTRSTPYFEVQSSIAS
jgi:hypothetical protein